MSVIKVRYELDKLVNGTYISRRVETVRSFPWHKRKSFVLYEGLCDVKAYRAIIEDVNKTSSDKVVSRYYYDELGNMTCSPTF